MLDQQSQTEHMLQLLNKLSAAQSQVAQAQQTANECVSELMDMFANDELAVAPAGFQSDLTQMHSMLNDLLMRTGSMPAATIEPAAENDHSGAAEVFEPAPVPLDASSKTQEQATSNVVEQLAAETPASIVNDIGTASESPSINDEAVSAPAPAADVKVFDTSKSAREEALETNHSFGAAYTTLTGQQPPVGSAPSDFTSGPQEGALDLENAHALLMGETREESQMPSESLSEHDAAMAVLSGDAHSQVFDQQELPTQETQAPQSQADAYDILTGSGVAGPFAEAEEAAAPSMADVRGAFGNNGGQPTANELPGDSLDQFENLLDEEPVAKGSRPMKGNGDSFANFLSTNSQ